jgi:hypothetical protein
MPAPSLWVLIPRTSFRPGCCAAWSMGRWSELSWTCCALRSAQRTRAGTGYLAPLLLPRDAGRLDGNIPPEALAGVRADLASGHLVVAPREAMTLDKSLRYAWWRINPRTGESVAVTDEGLHQATTEHQSGHVVVKEEVEVGSQQYIYRIQTGLRSRAAGGGGQWSGWRITSEQTFTTAKGMFDRVAFLLRDGSIRIGSAGF